MPLLPTVLASELKSLELYDNELGAINGWAAAYKKYMEGATSNGVTIVPAALIAPELAMQGALGGLSILSSTSLQTGILAFWGVIIPAIAWPTTLAIAPPALLAGLGATLTGIFTSNTTSKLSKDASMDAIANAIHAASLGGTTTWPGPAVMPIL